jgi:hypothetical protein
MKKNKTKDRRINIRLDEDTFIAIKKIVQDDLKTDISSYCRSLLWISTLHGATVNRIKSAVTRFGKERNTENLEYMLRIKNEIEFIEKFLRNMKENRKKYDDFISMIEKWHETIKDEARKYFSIYNEIIDSLEKEYRDFYGEEYDTNPTIDKPRGKIDI